MTEQVDDVWTALRNCLEARGRALHEEVRSYPTPIARCDEQLTQVIEQRDAVFRRLRGASDLDRVRPLLAHEEWLCRLRVFAASLETGDDAALAAARERLVAALGHR